MSEDNDFTSVFIKCLCRVGGVDSFGSTSVERDLTKLRNGFVPDIDEEEEDKARALDGEETFTGLCSRLDEMLVEMASRLCWEDDVDKDDGTSQDIGDEEASAALTAFPVGLAVDSDVGIDVSITAMLEEVAGSDVKSVGVSKYRSSLASTAVTMFWSSRSSQSVSSSSSSSFPRAEKRIVMVSREMERWTSTLGAVALAVDCRDFSPWLPSRLVIAVSPVFQHLYSSPVHTQVIFYRLVESPARLLEVLETLAMQSVFPGSVLICLEVSLLQL